jgi:XTP/dITP diphosphohydrolase
LNAFELSNVVEGNTAARMDRADDRENSHTEPGPVIPLLLASGNPGKLLEYRALAASGPAGVAMDLDLLSGFGELPEFDESALTFAENAAGKARHYSQFAEQPVFADDSGLVVPALGGPPGVHSARYAGPHASDAERVSKLLNELRAAGGADRRARFVCVIALADRGQVLGVFSAAAEGEILDQPRGQGGFGYDPVFYFSPLNKTFAQITREEKNLHSHRGKAFRKLQEFLVSTPAIVLSHPR